MKKPNEDQLETIRTLLRYLGNHKPNSTMGSGGMQGVKVKKTITIDCPNYACDCTITIELPSEEYQMSHSYSNYELEQAVYEMTHPTGNEDSDDNS